MPPCFCGENMAKRTVELLAPAGSMEAFRGALNAGADAVYLAGRRFGARAYADNFDEEELADAIGRAHLFGVRVYLTVNVLTRQDELEDLGSFVSAMYRAGLDGVIVQDLGTAACLHRLCPGLELHASTQMSVTGPEAVRFLKQQGFVRVVPARELSLQEIGLLKKEGIEIESFIHGAMCYSYSGRCLMSSFLGGRSGNRGRCAGTCRLPYQIVEEDGRPIGRDGSCYLISMRDMCVLPILPELMDAGIDSFKIEGRMKKPEYAAGTTAIYRKYIDRFYAWDASGRPGRWQIEKEDLEKLYRLYIRTELCRGYYHVRNGREMVTIQEPGYKGVDPKQLERIRATYLRTDRKRAICGEAEVCVGKPASLRVRMAEEDGARDGRPLPETTERGTAGATATGFAATELPVQEARSRALTREEIHEKLSKTGDSPFSFRDLQVTTDGHAFLPVSALGELRRKALQELTEACCAEWTKGRTSSEEAGGAGTSGFLPGTSGDTRAEASGRRCPCPAAEQQLMVMVQSIGQARTVLDWSRQHAAGMELILDGEAREYGAQILEESRREGGRIAVLAALPYVLRETDRAWLRGFYEKNRDIFYGFVTRSLEELEFLIEEEYDNKVIVDSGLYVWNRESESVLRNSVRQPGNLQMVLPAELDRKELYRTFAADQDQDGGRGSLADKILPVYGRTPLMISANCVRKTGGSCLRNTKEQGGYCGLADRRGTVFPVWTDCRHCQNVVYNSVPLSLHKFAEDPLWRGVRALLVSFTTENRQKILEVLNVYDGLRAQEHGRKSGQSSSEFRWKDEFTNGHFKKGAE